MANDFELMLRLRNRFANDGMDNLINGAQKLINKYGYEGAEDFLNWQLKVLRDLQSDEEDILEEDDAMGYQEDATKSLWAFDNAITPALHSMGVKEVYSTETHDNALAKFLDQETGIDAMIVTPNDATHPVACRTQFGKCYGSFTLRRSRPSGAPTEYDKIKKAKQADSLRPKYHIQAYITGDKATVAMANTDDIVAYADAHPCEWLKTQDGETFFVIPWRKLDKVKIEYVDLSRNQ